MRRGDPRVDKGKTPRLQVIVRGEAAFQLERTWLNFEDDFFSALELFNRPSQET